MADVNKEVAKVLFNTPNPTRDEIVFVRRLSFGLIFGRPAAHVLHSKGYSDCAAPKKVKQ
jgi:hypothetical protein